MTANTPIKISVFIITLNEAKHIKAVLDSVASLDEVIVVDSGSTDGTPEIAKAMGAKVIHQAWLGFAKQKDFALQQCQNQWCFNLDGDEIVPAEVLAEITDVVESNQYDAIRVNFEDIFMGSAMHPKSHKRSIVRVYNKDKIQFPLDKHVHENVKVTGTTYRIKGNITHYGYHDVATLMSKQNKYSSLGALEKFERGKKPSMLKLCLVFPLIFLKCLLLRKMWRSGYRGVVHAAIEAMYAFLKEAKLLELSLTKHQQE